MAPTMARPGSKPADPSGCMYVFFAIFAAAGVAMLGSWAITVAGLRRMTDDQNGAMVGGIICSCVALFGFWLAGWTRKAAQEAQRPTGSAARKLPKYFPELKKPPIRGPSGGVLLNPQASRKAQLFGVVFITLFWNGIVSVFVVLALKDGVRGIHLIGALCMTPFILVGLLLVWGTIHQLLLVMRVPPTLLEVGAELLAPGESTRVRLYQRGSFPINRATITLVYRETATTGSGDDERKHKHEIVLRELADARDLHASDDRPIMNAELAIPGDAMHSFKTGRTSIEWLLRVKIDIPGRPDVKEELGIRVAAKEALA